MRKLSTSTISFFAGTMSPWRLTAATILSITAMIVWPILDHHLSVNLTDYLALAWLLAFIATVCGALGSGLEHDDDVVADAAYEVRQSQRTDKTRSSSPEGNELFDNSRGLGHMDPDPYAQLSL